MPLIAGGVIASATIALLLVGALGSALRISAAIEAVLLLVCAHGAIWLLLGGLDGREGEAGIAFYALCAAAWLLAWRLVSVLSSMQSSKRPIDLFLRLLIPAVFGAWLLILWEVITRGAGIPFILLPPPSAIGLKFSSSLPVLWADVNQTVFRSAVVGYALGCGARIATATPAPHPSA